MSRKLKSRILAYPLVAALMIATALAVDEKKDSGGKVVPTVSEKCWVTPDPVANGQEVFTVNGSGFRGGQTLSILVEGSGWLMTSSDYAGDFAASAWAAFTQTGTQNVRVYRSGDRRMIPLASCSFVVQ